jgi:ApaG protein
MHGSFFCVAEDGERFDCPVVAFELLAEGASPARTLH